jgi:hypothetical protein
MPNRRRSRECKKNKYCILGHLAGFEISGGQAEHGHPPDGMQTANAGRGKNELTLDH